MNVQHNPILRPSKGVHVIVNKHLTDQALLLESKDKRLFFVIPWDNQTLVGTTDTEYEGNIQEVQRKYKGNTKEIQRKYKGHMKGI